MQVHSDASNLKDVFDAGMHKLALEFNIDKDTAATYAHEVMRKRRRSDDSVKVSAPVWRLNEASTQVLEHKGHVTRVG